MTTTTEFQAIPLSRLRPSPLNPRKHFDQAKLDELAESIKAHGVLQPIVARAKHKVTKLTKTIEVGEVLGFEIVAGERRYRAAQLAGLAEIPARVVVMDDRTALEVMVVENDQRSDVTPLERAEGYAALIEQHGVSIEDLAARVGRSVSTIRGLLKLRNLPEKAREALDAGELPASTAELIARIPNDKLRKEAAKRAKGYGGEYRSYRDVKQMVERQFMMELKQAPFSVQDATLCPSAGACTTCPKRAGNNREEYPDGRADVCTDPGCYESKVKAHGARLVETAKAGGKKVLTAKEAKEVFDYHGGLNYRAPYVDLDATCYDDRKHRTYKQILGKTANEHSVLAHDPKGRLQELIPKAGLAALLKAAGVKRERGGGDDGNSSWRRQQAKRRAEDLLDKQAMRRAMGIVAEEARSVACGIAGFPPKVVEMFRLLVAEVVHRAWDDVSRQVKKRRGLEAEKTGHSGGNRDPVAALVPTLDAPGLVGLWAELMAGQKWGSFYGDREKKPFWSFFGVDFKKIQQDVRRDQAAKKSGSTAKAKPPENGKAKASANGKPSKNTGRLARSIPPLEEILEQESDQDAAEQARANGSAGNKRSKLSKAVAGKCRICECTEADCRRCVERTGEPCSWTSPAKDLCTACEPLMSQGLGLIGMPAQDLKRLAKNGVRTVGQLLDMACADGELAATTGTYGHALQMTRDWLQGRLRETPEGDPIVTPEEMPPAGTITRDTYLIDLLPGNDVSKEGRALEDARIVTVGDLLAKAKDAQGPEAQRPYTVLRAVKGLGGIAATEIGDALVDAGLIVTRVAGWRSCLVSDLEISPKLIETLERVGVTDLGILADRLDTDLACVKPREAEQLREQIELARADD